MSKNNAPTTSKQKKAVDNVLSGKFKTKKEALVDAGYSEKSASHSYNVLNGKGVHSYLERLDERVNSKFGITLSDKVAEVLVDGLEATRFYGKQEKEKPDYSTRLKYIKIFIGLMGWKDESSTQVATQNQYNFFNVSQDKQEEFNRKFIEFVRNNPPIN